ncbi:DUF6168 family protein [Flagellimonas meridianipacifica]|uniref:Uncharacterized protein n=1 Tax=Flagellimonas meridianipacifica TaxID=1080225 RepID=A0A2T0MHC6_9FLAO|nr:DUF6168 family protein [Allomuricauda pacifica]PRX56978.1 hypothetical protein CLV81_0979 [Allomuricauda pacifica]
MKRGFILSLGIVLCFALAYFLNLTFVPEEQFSKIALNKHYAFHLAFSFLVCLLFFGLNHHKKWKEQLGFIYLGTFFLKLVIFVVVFQDLVKPSKSLENIEVFLVLIPLFLGLVLEVFVISQLLNKTDKK